MARFDNFHARDDFSGVIVLRHNDTAGKTITKNVCNGSGHSTRSLADANQKDTVISAKVEAFIARLKNVGFQREMPEYSFPGMNGRETCMKNGGGVTPQLRIDFLHD
jgi:hypothetical protein